MHTTPKIYLDTLASGPLDPAIARRLNDLQTSYGHTASSHHHGREVRALVDHAAGQVAALLDASPGEIVFTGSGTEANNHAIKGVGLASLGSAAQVVTTAIEHPSVLGSCHFLRQLGVEVVEVKPDKTGRIDPQRIADAITGKTVLVSVQWVNHVTGAIQPIEELTPLCRERGVLLHSDASCAAGRLPVSSAAVDLLSLSGHKLFGPQGVGALYIRDGVELLPFIDGEAHQQGRRGGTVPFALCAGMGEAARQAHTQRDTRAAHLSGCVERWLQTVTAELDDVRINGPRRDRLPGALNLSADGTTGVELQKQLDAAGVSVSAGLYPDRDTSTLPGVLKAMGITDRRARAALRLSPGPWTTHDEIDRAAAAYITAVRALRGESPKELVATDADYRGSIQET